MSEFRSQLGEHIFRNKYANHPTQTWAEKARLIGRDVCGAFPDLNDGVTSLIRQFKFIPGGRYIYYAGRQATFWNNCYLLRAEYDTREEWADLCKRSMSCLSSGGGIGVDYSRIRAAGLPLKRTGGVSSGPIPLMMAINEIGRQVMQGGSRRSAIYASLNWQHDDAYALLTAKNWYDMKIGDTSVGELKEHDFNHPAPLDMTNVSLNYDDAFLEDVYQGNLPDLFIENVRQALMTGEPGFSFNFGRKANETLRNACTEVTSEDDSDVCNLGSVNMAEIETLEEFKQVVDIAARFLVHGTLGADLPYDKVRAVREKNRRLGLGLMGVHEWLLKRGYRYGMNNELRAWMHAYETISEKAANDECDRMMINRPAAYRSIAPTGTIGILAGTTTGIEPLFATAYKRRYLVDGTHWKYECVVDPLAKILVDEHGTPPDEIETALDLSRDPERRIAFQADVQDFVDMAISSTINLPQWGTEDNNASSVHEFARTLAKYAPRLRGFTCYPDGSRGGQPLTTMDYSEAIANEGVVFEESSDYQCKSGICGI